MGCSTSEQGTGERPSPGWAREQTCVDRAGAAGSRRVVRAKAGTSLGSGGSAWAGGSSWQGKQMTGFSWKAICLFALLRGQKQSG